MAPSNQFKVIFFDLDNTLFDRTHSWDKAISAMQIQHAELRNFDTSELVSQFQSATAFACKQYMKRRITYEEKDFTVFSFFFSSIGLQPPTRSQVEDLEQVYQAAYRSDRRATPGTIETLVRLREQGYTLAIITNGETNNQVSKAKDIGVFDLVDAIITSEDAQSTKPERQVFDLALSKFGASASLCLMVGDKPCSDISGALSVGMSGVLYAPSSKHTSTMVSGYEVRTISHMCQLLGYLKVDLPCFEPLFFPRSDCLTIYEMGINLITLPYDDLVISAAAARYLGSSVEIILRAISTESFGTACTAIDDMISMVMACTVSSGGNRAQKIHCL